MRCLILVAEIVPAFAACADSLGPDGSSEDIRVLDMHGLTSAGPPTPNKHACTDPENPHCLPGDDDPFPSAPGKYFDVAGTSMSRTYCENDGNDADQDGIGDLCEHRLAEYFRPEMRSSISDNLQGEPYYIVDRGFYDQFGVLDHASLNAQPDLVQESVPNRLPPRLLRGSCNRLCRSRAIL